MAIYCVCFERVWMRTAKPDTYQHFDTNRYSPASSSIFSCIFINNLIVCFPLPNQNAAITYSPETLCKWDRAFVYGDRTFFYEDRIFFFFPILASLCGIFVNSRSRVYYLESLTHTHHTLLSRVPVVLWWGSAQKWVNAHTHTHTHAHAHTHTHTHTHTHVTLR